MLDRVPILYAALLWASRDALLSGRPTRLSRAIAFLADDYRPTGAGFWWELIEMNRKLVLTGWVLVSPLGFESQSFAHDYRLTGVGIPVWTVNR